MICKKLGDKVLVDKEQGTQRHKTEPPGSAQLRADPLKLYNLVYATHRSSNEVAPPVSQPSIYHGYSWRLSR